MPVVCPYCQHPIKVKGAKPGRYTPKCSKCSKAFALTVPADTGQEMTAAPLSPTAKAPPAARAPSPPPAKTAPTPTKPKAPPTPTASAADSSPAVPNLGATIAPGEGTDDNPDFSVSPPNLGGTLAAIPGATPDSEEFSMAPGVGNPDGTTADAGTDRPNVTEMLGGTMDEGEEEPPVQQMKKKAPASDVKMPDVLGGYQIVRELGRGGMGAVYLARQVSLDRNVALKVMNPQWADNPTFMARFTREAYAAAQLVHHNVVQVYDIGEDHGINYFSMEFVEGQSLQDLVKKEGKLDPEVATGYVLQAARGLKFAHDRGMIHRDIKPDNLMLNTEGIVKVADLGLVRTPGAVETPPDPAAAEPEPAKQPLTKSSLASLGNITLAHQAMGTPTYMPPEQARDATRVDHRADIYSLGCTLYVMVSGKAPFTGRTALEVMTKHATEPLVPPEVIVQRVPRQLSAIVVKMMAKKPEDRYGDMGEVVKAMEDFLGVQAAGKFSPREEHAQTLESCLKRFNEAPGARIRKLFFLGFFGGCALLFLLLLLFSWTLAGGILGLGVLTGLAYFAVDGLMNRSHLFMKSRELVLDSTWVDWLTWGGGFLFFLLILWVLSLLPVWIGVCLLAVGIAVGFHYLIDRPLAVQRREPLEQMQKLLRELRLKGLDEESLRQFVCKYSGDRWEEFYEALFGYEAKMDARARWGKGMADRPREKYAAWRDTVAAWIDARRRARKEAREQKHLQQIEQKNLQAQGMSADEAKQKAERAAAAMVKNAAEVKAPSKAPLTEATVAESTESLAREKANEELLRRRVESMLGTAEKEERDEIAAAKRRRSFHDMAGAFFGIFLGVRTRVLLGLLLLALSLWWLQQNRIVPGAPDVDLAHISEVWSKVQKYQDLKEGNPLQIPLVPVAFTQPFSSINAVAAGLLLVVSIFWSGNRIGLFLIPAAAVMIAGPFFWEQSVGPLTPHLVSLAAGGALAVLGYLFGRLPTQ